LIPVAENAVSGTAMRPGDILATRKGLTIEVNNTDAEGRLILADALCEGDREDPAVLIDFATLTGAARVALGADIPALFCNEDSWADSLMRAGMDNQDPLWRLPLWPGYRSMVEGRVGDLDNAPEGGMAGAITAALFLERFVSASTPWAHIDTYGWSPKARPAHPVGGDALGMRAVFAALRDRFG
jgi:leucyl aminopeptidase